MQLMNAVMAARMLTMLNGDTSNGGLTSESIPFGSFQWFLYAGFSCFFVIFAGIMSGLTLGLMSLGLVDLEILQRSGTSTEKKQAGSDQIPSSSFSMDFVEVFVVDCFCLMFFSGYSSGC